MYELELIRSAETLAREVIKVKKGHKVLIVTDSEKLKVGNAFALTCRGLGAEVVIAIMPISGEHGSEPPATIAAAMRAADIVFAPTTHAITHTRARLDAYAAGAKVVILRGVTEDMMVKGAMTVDFKKLQIQTQRIAKILADANEIQVNSDSGTNVTFSVAGRNAFSLDGYFHDEYGFATLPPGEAPTCPVEGTTNGMIVFDYSMDGIGKLSQPLKLKVEKGQVVAVSGEDEDVHFLEQVFARDSSARNIAEFAIGTNPNARLIGNLAEDKKLAGTVHFAVGDNESLGGVVQSSIHLDGLMLKPTVHADQRLLVEKGKLIL